MKNLVVIGIPVLLVVPLFFDVGGKGYDAVALLLLLVGGYVLAKSRAKGGWLYATIYVVGLESLFFLFS
jgi:hypothetical protein